MYLEGFNDRDDLNSTHARAVLMKLIDIETLKNKKAEHSVNPLNELIRDTNTETNKTEQSLESSATKELIRGLEEHPEEV